MTDFEVVSASVGVGDSSAGRYDPRGRRTRQNVDEQTNLGVVCRAWFFSRVASVKCEIAD